MSVCPPPVRFSNLAEKSPSFARMLESCYFDICFIPKLECFSVLLIVQDPQNYHLSLIEASVARCQLIVVSK